MDTKYGFQILNTYLRLNVNGLNGKKLNAWSIIV